MAAEPAPGWLKDSIASRVHVKYDLVREWEGRTFFDPRVFEIREYQDVPFIFHGPGFGILHEGTLHLFPWDRLYDVSFDGESRDRILEVVRIMSEDQKRTIDGVRRSQETVGPERM